jgi:ribose transport system permease protein
MRRPGWAESAVRKELVVAHVLCGMFAGTAGIMLTGYIGTGTLNLGADLVMASVAAVVLGWHDLRPAAPAA